MFFEKSHEWRNFYSIFLQNHWLRFLKNLHSSSNCQKYIFESAIFVKKKSNEGYFL